MLASALLILALQDVNVTYEPFAGLQVKFNGVPFIVGSSFQYFDADSGKGLYSSRWAPKDVSRLPDGTIRVRYSGDNGNAIGTHEFTQRPGGLTVRYEFRWRGDGDVRVENCLAQFWAPAVSHGDLRIDGGQLFAFANPSVGDWSARRLGAGKSFEFDSQVARTTVRVKESPAGLYDARGYTQDWAKLDCLFWLGQQQLIVHPGQTTSVTVEWDFEPRRHSHRDLDRRTLASTRSANALVPPPKRREIVPRPKVAEPSAGQLVLQGDTNGPLPPDLVTMLARRWRVEASEVKFPLETRIDGAGLQDEAFDVRVTPAGVTVRAHDSTAQRYAFDLLAQLSEARNGRLVLPCGHWKDWPSVQSRGVHLFSARGALPFQIKLIDRLLGPLRFNRAVVECSRTQWDSAPEAKSKPWTTKGDLAALFAAFRTHGITPVPLIQSFGHMDWLLDGEFKTLAVNPDIPYTLDTRKSAARDLVKSVWREAADLLKPTIVHFGLDEISMRGMPDDPTLPLRLWKAWAPELRSLARTKNVTPMAWGDMMLAAGEAPDATHARNAEDAAAFRSLLPKGTIIGDWHYKATKDPAQFTSLALWKSLGMSPVATSWYQPENIRSHTLAAVTAGAGTLQVTWAGYETTEAAMIRDPAQFSAYVLAADYAWSGRSDAVADLPYNPASIVREWIWGVPDPIKPYPGLQWSTLDGKLDLVRVGSVGFQMFEPLGLQTPLTLEGSSSAGSLELALNAEATEVWLALDTVGWMRDTDSVAKVTVVSGSGDTVATVLYGADVRAAEDVRPLVRCASKSGVSAFRVLLADKRQVTSVRIEPLSPTAGMRVRGVTTL